MCSIAGVYWFGDNRSQPNELSKMVEKALSLLKNRGPDESSVVVVRDNCVMGGNRLIIRGDSGKGTMPFKCGKNILFYNGEIYNYKIWNKDATSDGEVILPLYDKLKTKTFSRFDGEFAISLWDGVEKKLLLARDQFGTKPIYFSLNANRLLWASSASAVNKMEGHDFCLSVKGPTYQHSYAVQEPYTSYKGIWLIPPGHFLVVNKSGVQLFCYNFWGDYLANSEDTNECFKSLIASLKSRMDYSDTIGIPMSAGIDSGIIAFTADKLKVKYHIFSVVEIFGEKTDEADYILERIKRLKNVSNVTLLKCNEEQYQKALKEMYLNDYYNSEKFDNGNILMHTVFDAMKKEKIRVAIDGSGGDELFHGYKFRNDFRPVDDWPRPWKGNNFFYSLYTTLLDYTSKSDRAGAHFSIESRYPFQCVKLMKAALKLKYFKTLKWPLRKFLIENTNYGPPMNVDLFGKFGFSVKNRNKNKMILDMQQAWCQANKLLSLPQDPPEKFPFTMGLKMN